MQKYMPEYSEDEDEMGDLRTVNWEMWVHVALSTLPECASAGDAMKVQELLENFCNENGLK